MSFVHDFACGITLGVIYDTFIHKIATVGFGSLPYNERYQKIMCTVFIFGILGIVLAQTLFHKNKKFKNRIVRIGLISGSLSLLFHSTINNWDKLSDNTKLIIYGLIIGGLIWYSYYYYKKQKDKENEKLEEELENIDNNN
jgi:H+/Cl- antiporter ClcA